MFLEKWSYSPKYAEVLQARDASLGEYAQRFAFGEPMDLMRLLTEERLEAAS